MSGKTKKRLILEIFDQESMTSLGESEVQVIQKKLVAALGPEGRSSRGYIARVVGQAGKPVHITDPFAAPLMEEPYSRMFEGVLKFGTLDQAEQSLRQIGALYAQFKADKDEKGMAYARSIVLVGKRRAQAAGRRAKSAEVREVKDEIAEWFTLWLYDPLLFNDWLELRKKSPEFQDKWGGTRNLVGE